MLISKAYIVILIVGIKTSLWNMLFYDLGVYIITCTVVTIDCNKESINIAIKTRKLGPPHTQNQPWPNPKWSGVVWLCFYYKALLQNDTVVMSRCVQFTFGDKGDVYLLDKSAYLWRKKRVCKREKNRRPTFAV